MAETYGQTDSLAQAIVSRINTISNTLCIPVQAERRFFLLTKLTDIPTVSEPASIDIFPDVEMSERQGLSTAFSSYYTVHMFLQQQVSGANITEEEHCSLLTRLRSEIIEDMKLRSFDLDDAVHPVDRVFLWQIKNADENGPAKGLYNLARLNNEHVYESDTILIFKASV